MNRFALDLPCPNKWRLEVFKNVKCIAVPLRASKLQVFKGRPSQDFNQGLPHESLNIGILTHAGGPGSNPGQAELWRLVAFKPLKLQQCTLHFWKPLIFFYLVKSVAVCSVYDMLLGIHIGLLHKIAKRLTVFWLSVEFRQSLPLGAEFFIFLAITIFLKSCEIMAIWGKKMCLFKHFSVNKHLDIKI